MSNSSKRRDSLYIWDLVNADSMYLKYNLGFSVQKGGILKGAGTELVGSRKGEEEELLALGVLGVGAGVKSELGISGGGIDTLACEVPG